MIIASLMGQHVGSKKDLGNRIVLPKITLQSTTLPERMAPK